MYFQELKMEVVILLWGFHDKWTLVELSEEDVEI